MLLLRPFLIGFLIMRLALHEVKKEFIFMILGDYLGDYINILFWTMAMQSAEYLYHFLHGGPLPLGCLM